MWVNVWCFGYVALVFRLLGRLYAAEALVLMDKVSEALEHLSPENIKDLSFEFAFDHSGANEEQMLKTSPPISKYIDCSINV